MWLVTWILKSSSSGITKLRQFEEPINKQSMLVCLPALSSMSIARVCGESEQGGPRSCFCSASDFEGHSGDFSGRDTWGKWSLSDMSQRPFGHSRAMWLLSPQLKHCFPVGHSDLMWLVLPQLKRRLWGFLGQSLFSLMIWFLHHRSPRSTDRDNLALFLWNTIEYLFNSRTVCLSVASPVR